MQAPKFPELVTQTYFQGESLPDNEFFQQLNAKDLILRDPALKTEEQERLIVEYTPGNTGEVFEGRFDFIVQRRKG